MKTLYESIMQFRSQSHEIEESILSKAGVGKIYSIRKWVENHLSLSSFTWALADNIDEHVSFNSDDSINVSGYEPWFFLDYDEKIPDFIQFRKAETFALAWNGVIDDWSFLPSKMQRLFLTNRNSFGVTTVKNLKLDLGKIQMDPDGVFEINTTQIDIRDIEIKMGKSSRIRLSVPAKKYVNIKCDATDILLDFVSAKEISRLIKIDRDGYVKNMDDLFPKKNYPNLKSVVLSTQVKDLIFDKGIKKWRLM